jgi:succinate dehydrogenase flavin-adding protein (antitoxin of CptAB toxin-antitoxin module)
MRIQDEEILRWLEGRFHIRARDDQRLVRALALAGSRADS